MKLKDIVLGIDLGGTIHHRNENKEVVPQPDAFRVISDLVGKVKGVYIVSRVSDEQSFRAYQWFQKYCFFENTNLTPNKVHFCYERIDKGPICWKLGVTHFIDDRPEVMTGLQEKVVKLLMNPIMRDVEHFQCIQRGHHIVNNWLEVESFFKSYES